MIEKPSRKREKFAELATKRVNRACKDLELIGNLSNRNYYEYTDDDVKLILKELNKALTDVKRRFFNGDSKDSKGFHIAP